MKHLLAWIAALSISFALILCGLVTVTRRVPVSGALTAQGIGVCGESACFLGIVPGVTDWREVPRLLREMPIEYMTGATDRRFSAAERFDIYRNPPGYEPDRVGTIIRQINAPLWEILQTFGWPCSVRLITRQSDSFGRFVLRYPFMEVFSNPPSGQTRLYNRLSPLLPMDTVLIRGRLSATESDRGSCTPTTDDWFELYSSWHGYASIQTYWRYVGH